MIWTIAKREIVSRARTKPFQILTFLLFAGVVAASVAISLLTGGDSDEPSEVTIGLEPAAAEFAGVLAAPNDEFDVTITMTDDDGRSELLGGNVDVLFDGETLTWEGFPQSDLDVFIRNSVQQAEFVERAGDLGLGPGELGTLFAEVPIEEERLDGSEDQQGIRIAAAMVSTVATFIMLQVWGAFLMMGVVEEKSSRVVEVLLSHISARTLLTGKVLGLGLLALSQLLILVAVLRSACRSCAISISPMGCGARFRCC